MGDNIQVQSFLQKRNHEHNDKDDFRTPMYLINWLKDKFGEGLRDGACTIGVNNKGEPINVFSPDSIEPEEWIYVNPPFDMKNVLMFVKACAKLSNDNDVVMLLPNKLCSKAYVLNVNHHFDEIIMLGGRICFESPYAVTGGSSMNGCFIGIMYSDVRKMNEYPVVKSITLSKIKEDYA
tara:strand:- start:644 stop:1180 length:537 start_codon:yes stop_codon:yes gene_type:complete